MELFLLSFILLSFVLFLPTTISSKALERLSQLINAIKYKIPIIEEGPTGTSKTFTTLIAIEIQDQRDERREEDPAGHQGQEYPEFHH